MRDRQEIEREMFAARQDLEDKLDHLVHRAREKVQVRARASHATREALRPHLGALIALAAVTGAAVALLLIWDRRRTEVAARLTRRRFDHCRRR